MIRELLVQFSPSPMVQVCTCDKVHRQLHKADFEFVRILNGMLIPVLWLIA